MLSYLQKSDTSELNPGDINLQEIYENTKFSGLKIIGVEYNGKSRIYIVLVQEFKSSVYLAVYDIKRERISTLRLIENFSNFIDYEQFVSAKAYLINNEYIYFYLLTTHKVLVMEVSNKTLSGKITNKLAKHDLKETINATMAVVSGYPFLAGGSLGGLRGSYIAYLGSVAGYFRYKYLHYERNNPILLQFQDAMYFIGGALMPKKEPLVEYHPLFFPKKEISYYGASIYAYSYRKNIVYPIVCYEEINLRVDALNAVAIPYITEIYLFTKQSFYYERTFYRFNILNNNWTIYEVDKNIFQQRKLKEISGINSVNVNNIGYIFLSGYQGGTFLIETFKFKPLF